MSTDFNLKILTGEMCASAVVARSNNHFHGIGGREIASEVWDRRIKLTHADCHMGRPEAYGCRVCSRGRIVRAHDYSLSRDRLYCKLSKPLVAQHR